MSDVAPTQSISAFRRLRFTPLLDLVRGRLSGRLDWKGRIAVSGLPAVAAAVVRGVVRRTRLGRAEKTAVADELIAHFRDGLAAGEDPADMVAAFGDPRLAAKLIRRGKRRHRSVLRWAYSIALRVGLVVVLLYGVAIARFVFGRPKVSVDYVARLNAPILRTPMADRAWPVYRQVLVALGQANGQHDETLDTPIDNLDRNGPSIDEARPTDVAAWRTLTGWLDAHAGGVSLLRQAAAKPELGFVLGLGGSENDAEVAEPRLTAPSYTDGSVIGVRLMALNHMRSLARILAADVRYAGVQGDGARAVADIDALLGIARQQGQTFLVAQYVRLGITEVAPDSIEKLLTETPAVLSDEQLIALAHRVANVGGDTAASVFDFAGERVAFYDVVQRMYSDDGHGGGHLTMAGLRQWGGQPAIGPRVFGQSDLAQVPGAALTGTAILLSSRRDVLAEYDRLMDLVGQTFTRPLRDWPAGQMPTDLVEARLQEIKRSPALNGKYLPITMLLSSMNRVAVSAERLLGHRDGVTVGLALELYRRRHGDYPATLDALVPTLLPAVPADRITGGPVKFRPIDGRPVVYSVGVDRDDDDAREVVGRNGEVDAWRAADWPWYADVATRADGDWRLFSAVPPPPREQPTTQPSP